MTRMKESGIDWIGQIPEEWEVRAIKHIVETPVTDGPHETPVLYETGIPFLSAEAVKDGILDFNYKRGYISLKDHERFKKKISPKKDDIFIVKSGATTGNVGIVNTDDIFDIWSPLALIRCNKTLAIQKYIYFYLLSTLFKAQVEFNWSFGTQQNIGMGVIERIKVILPPVSEQQKIADFLDKKTVQLDKVKALLEEQIQKFKDYRASLIYKTVTKGLDQTVPMKDSGIDWIGQVPEGWGVKAIKYIFDEIGSGSTPKSDNEIFYDGDINWIQSGDLYQTDTVTSVSKTISYQGFKSTSALKIYQQPFVALAMYGASVGNVAVSYIDACVNQAVVAMLGSSEKVSFGKYAIEASKSNLIFSAQGGTQPNISQNLIKNWSIPQPKNEEQEQVVDFLDKKTVQIDKLIQIKNEQIKNINKQRQTLIYDYVTGKRRV
ncbi:restriction endonuclease subunit S [Streptococcus sanguinis]|uniref:restriction endonuclease subunit S n=1 Tax=Streptococcus sanguinis TaxID=1305 RepID=UPI001CBD0D8B|nr:restriction endonuclease subunit S [Streptococcus sanguinis]MBZ2022476.1 restriction endonuclease subunit S [Streptococcus sanguinis]MBZ2047175.1 restriction endonuclease subunit S [Streptococcus sanguinis]MBZ2050129.1 restriction endonuclease subunit S [Streptococcus sanguinis]MBZ2058743.1 restriction endonuclease subunit S [Streptococcus sanguinis]